MNIKKLYFEQNRNLGLDIASALAACECQIEMSPTEYDAGLASARRIIEEMDRLEREHPRVENPKRRQRFEAMVKFALEMAELFSLDIYAEIDQQLCGRLTLIGDSLLLRSEYDFNALPLMKALMGMCEQFYAVPIEKYGCTLLSFSFIIPLYDRKCETA